jgi:hypothetical protein
MNDLLLWRLLRDRQLQPDALVPLLRDLARLPLAQRVPFLGLLPAALGHPEPALRAAAVAALAGAKGRPALQRLVHALDDAGPSVRLAAVDALRLSVHGDDTARWAHVLFHPSPDVRLAGLADDKDFPPPLLYKAFLLADDACRPTVERQLAQASLPADALPLLFDYLRRGIVSEPLARRLTAHLPWLDWAAFLGDLLPRTVDMTEALHEALQPGWADDADRPYRPDRLDDLLHLFWADDEPGRESGPGSRAGFFELLRQAALGEAPEFRQWVVFTLLGLAVQRRSWPPQAAEICAALEPNFLLCPWVPLDVRRAAVAGLYRAGPRCPRRPSDAVRPLLAGDVCWAEGQGGTHRLDLWAVGGVLHLLESNPYQHLLEWVGVRPIQEAFHADVGRAAPFLALPDASARGRRYLIRELALQPGAHRGRVLALIAQFIPSDGLDFLDSLDGQGACLVLDHLLDLEFAPAGPTAARPFSDNKARHLARHLAPKIAAGQVPRFLNVWLSRPAPEASALGQALLGRLAHDHDARALVPSACALELERLTHFLTACACCAGFPYDQELRLAAALFNHPIGPVRAWAERRLRDHDALQAARAAEEAAAAARAFQEAPGLRPGLVEQLRRRPDPAEADIEACQSLLACHDPADEVAEQFARFSVAGPEFLTRLDEGMVRHWRGEARLPLLGHAWLYRWDEHAAALARHLDAGAAGLLRWAAALPSVLLRRRLFEAVARVLELWRWHDRPRLLAAWTEDLADVLLAALSAEQGEVAARILLHWRDHAPGTPAEALLAPLRQRLVARLPDLPESVRTALASWVDTRGLPPAPTAAPEPPPPSDALLERLATSTDLDFLADCAARPEYFLAREAGSRLVELGEPGVRRLAELFARRPPPLNLLTLEVTIPHWPEGPALDELRRLARDQATVPELRFYLALGLLDRGERGLWPELLDALCQPGPVGWFDTSALLWVLNSNLEGPLSLAQALARSPHPHAYTWVLEELCAVAPPEPAVAAALRDFLEAGTERYRELRVKAAAWLADHGDRETALPILLGREPEAQPSHPALLCGLRPDLVGAVTAGVLMAGQGETAEQMLLALLDHGRGAWPPLFAASGPSDNWVDPVARQEALGQLLAGADSLSARQQARRLLRSGLGRAHKLRRVAETFAWGVRVGRQLTGKLFTLEMVAGEDLGYTRLRENKLFISPLPLLRGHPNAREVVRALILHEYGHHLYHKGAGAEEVWEEAESKRLHRLLNLVADEHLERNLRARDQGFGDQLKQLAAYAFQHTAREVPVDALLNGLRGRAFEVLTGTHLGVARKFGCVALSSGRILLQMEKAGLSFARFFRALRMGLGNRHGDPKVAQALELFKGRFRDATMPELLERARKLRDIFGDETDLLDSFNQDGALAGDADDLVEAGEGISNEEVQAEVRRTLEGSQGRRREGQRLGGRSINLSPEEQFETIAEVKHQAHDPARHAVYAQQVARPAGHMRRYLQQLGLGLVPQRFRLAGKRFDPTRARAVVLRGDPRMLVSRTVEPRNDLFMGVLIDCSGSMSSGGNIEKAKLFATLLAEAARGNRGIDLRLWGFTDRVIYDAGTAARPAVHDLYPDDGNNDAAALWHAAEVARASPRRAKLLVMISDGSPTQCSVAALRALVQRLTARQKVLCAQVAVAPLDEVCFPHYVLLEENDQAACVRRFGATVLRLVRQALRG